MIKNQKKIDKCDELWYNIASVFNEVVHMLNIGNPHRYKEKNIYGKKSNRRTWHYKRTV